MLMLFYIQKNGCADFLKKIFSMILILSILFSLSACSLAERERYALDIEGVGLSEEIYRYYYDAVKAKPDDYGLEAEADDAAIRECVKSRCAEYVAVNSELANMGLALDGSRKSSVADTVTKLWITFGEYYTSIGVSKQTITKIESFNAARDMLFNAYYNTGGTREVNAEEVKKYFAENYVGFKAIIGYFFKTNEVGSEVMMTTEEKNEAIKKFNTMKDQIDAGADIAELGSNYTSTYGINYSEMTILRSDSTLYPIGFFQAVWALEPGTPGAFPLGDYVFLVIREDISKAEDGYFEQYKDDCLSALRSEEFERIIDYITAQYKVTENSYVIDRIK